MNIAEAKEQSKLPLRQATLCFLVRGDEILLGLKKRGFAEGKWNGVGGKKEDIESIEDTAIRETIEEIGVTPKSVKHVATLNFFGHGHDQQVYVYVCTEWEGDPAESDEIRPQWFSSHDLPFDQMWPDDPLWLPHVLSGKLVSGDFLFDSENNLVDQTVSFGTV